MWQRKNKFVNKAASRQIRGMPSRPGISTFGNTYRVVQPPSPSPQLAPPVPPQQSMLSAKRNAFAMSGNRNRADSGGSGSPYSTGRDKEPRSPLMSRSNDIRRAESGIGDERLRVKENDIDNNNEPALLKRKDFLDIDEEAKNHPNRTYYYRKFQDVDRLIETFTAKIMQSSKSGRMGSSRKDNLQIDLKSHFLRGMAFVKKQEYRRAIADFTTVLTVDHNDIAAFYNRGMAYSKLRQMNDAIADFTRVLDVDPNHVNAAYARAACYNSKGQFSKAIEDYNIALMKDQEKAEGSGRGAGSSGVKGVYGGGSTPVSAHKRQGSMVVGAAAYARQREEALRIQMGPRMASPPPGSLTPSGAFQESFFSSDVGTPRINSQIATTQAVAPQQLPMSLRTGFTAASVSDDGEYGSGAQDMDYEEAADPSNLDPRLVVSASSRAAEMRKGAEQLTGFFDKTSSVSNVESKMTVKNSEQKFPSSRDASLKTNDCKPFKSTALHPDSTATTHIEADEHHARGFALRKDNDFKGAVEEYTKAISKNPTHFKAYFNRGFAWDKLRQFDKAIQDYTTALQLDPNNAYAYYNRGISRDRASTFQEAIDDFSEAIRLMPGNSDFYHNRGFCYRKQGDFNAAIADYTEALQCDPHHYKAVYNRAFSYDKLGQHEKALADYTRALQMQPNNSTAYHNRGNTLEKMGRLEAAMVDFSRAAELDTNSSASKHARALLLDKMGRHEEALTDFSAAITQEPLNALYYHNRGLCYRNLGDYTKAIENYNRAVQLDATYVAAYNNRGYAFRKLGNFGKAVEDYTTSLELDESNIKTLNNRGYSYAKQTKYTEAILDYTRVIELDSNNAHAYHNRGISYDKIGDFEKAITDFTKVLELESIEGGEQSSNAGAALQHRLAAIQKRSARRAH